VLVLFNHCVDQCQRSYIATSTSCWIMWWCYVAVDRLQFRFRRGPCWAWENTGGSVWYFLTIMLL